MRINKTKSKNYEHYSIIQDITKNGKRTTRVYENIGNYEKLKLRAGDKDPFIWLNEYVEKLNKENKNKKLPVIIKKYENKLIELDKINSYNIGYLFLQKIYYNLKLNYICEEITNKYQFKFDFNSILSTLIYSRIIYPSSKLKTLELSKKFIEQPNFEYQHISRALEIIAKEMDFIQSEVYKNSEKFAQRNNKILYYDCTNFFFEIEEEDGLKQYGKSKENRPNPIVQMGLFMDGDGLPLAFDITSGNTNEQKTLKPLEQKIIKDFETSKFVVCTDAGLASNANKKFNNINSRSFITTQSIKKLKGHLKDWCLDLTKGWKLFGSDKKYNISKLREDEKLIERYKDKTFYKERWINEDGLEQRLIVTYSVKYQEYQKNIREKQLDRARKLIETNPKKIGKAKQNDFKRFIETTVTTPQGEVAEEKHYNINEEKIIEESKYDGLYAVCTNLEDDVNSIIKTNHNRWEIEESFRIMKSEFKSRPVYLSRDDRIKAHFVTCFLALLVFRYLEKKLNNEYTAYEIIDTLKNMNLKLENDGYYSPIYTRTSLTDKLHDEYHFRTDYEILSEKNLKKIFSSTKK
ncbi:MAG: IS1634 family transposase [Erysipelotrichaceae bacterium]|nr:IS1634 family transposase [Erysipelotrichaceae bacterium]